MKYNINPMSKFLSILLVLLGSSCFAQDELFDLLNQDEEKSKDPVIATFKGTKLVNAQTNEISGAGVLQFVILHRFGTLSDDFLYNFLGLDNAQVRFSLDYSFHDRINLGIGRSNFLKMYDGWIKAQILKQYENGFPFSFTWYSSANYRNLRWPEDGLERLTSDRLAYVHQGIIARKESSAFSWMLLPTVVHYNLQQTQNQPNTIFVLGTGFRYKLSNRLSLNAEYLPMLNRNTYVEANEKINYVNAFSLGVDIETGGHVFQLHITNSRGLSDPIFLTQTTGNWIEGEIYFGFNISRVFTVKKPKEFKGEK